MPILDKWVFFERKLFEYLIEHLFLIFNFPLLDRVLHFLLQFLLATFSFHHYVLYVIIFSEKFQLFAFRLSLFFIILITVL